MVVDTRSGLGQCCVLLALLTPDESVSFEYHFGRSYNLRTNRSRLLVQSLAKLMCPSSQLYRVPRVWKLSKFDYLTEAFITSSDEH